MPETQDGDNPPLEALSRSQTLSLSPPTPFHIPKNRSAGSLLSLDTQARTSSESARKRASFQDGAGPQDSRQTLSPIFAEHDHGFALTGLNRIRQHPPPRIPSPGSHARQLARSVSMNAVPTPPHELTRQLTEPHIGPVAGIGEDLTRFTTESLHSFSFANQADDFIHTRHSVLKRSIDFLRDRQGWAGGNVGIAEAQAKLSGDPEMQSMMELLSRAKLLGSHGGDENLESTFGPFSGPAEVSNQNPFEKSFGAQTESPTSIGPIEGQKDDDVHEDNLATPTQGSVNVTVQPPEPSSTTGNPRATLKRTFTDIAPLSLQSKLTDALSQPFVTSDNSMLAPLTHTTSIGSAPLTPGIVSSTAAAHAHGRGGPSQSIFMTETKEPWVTTAANDLGCLVFGLSKAELRTISILEIFREDKRNWLRSKLRGGAPNDGPVSSPPSSPRKTSGSSWSSAMGNGVTARLLRKPPSREAGRTAESSADTSPKRAEQPSRKPSRGVLLCGDVLPIRKRNGAEGSATLWVQEKRGALIWVLEEIAEDVAYLSVDEVGCVTKVSGASEAVWGLERVRRGMDITRLLPSIPRLKGTNTGALDFDMIAELRRFTARTANDISIPVTVDQLSGESTFRVSSFPHIAGMMVLSASTLHVSSCNTVVSDTLFGSIPNGKSITTIIPAFDEMLNHLVEEDKIQLVEGMVIPEYSFRRARAMLALREGKEDAAAVFLRPSGLLALHRDGAEIMIDVQMRVLKSSTIEPSISAQTIGEDAESPISPTATTKGPASEMVYALWVTYSRVLHAVNHGVGPISPIMSRPGTPPQQPFPGDGAPSAHTDDEEDDDETDKDIPLEIPASRAVQPAPQQADDAGDSSLVKKSINDYVILEDMGAGAYGQVKLARPKGSQSNNKVVIKYVTKRRILVDTWTRDRRLGTVPLEIHVLDHLRHNHLIHPNIIEMREFFEDDTNYYIVMPPHGLPGMDLFDYIELRMEMGEDESRRIFKQVAEAVEFLHVKAKVVHRDIKDENVILDGEGRIKLIDFGSAAYIKSGPFDVFVGTIDYAAPEVLVGTSYSGLEQDVWALGILLYTILYKENPFYSIDEIMDRELRIPYVVSEDSLALIRRMLDRDVAARIRIADVVKDPWTRGGGDAAAASPVAESATAGT